MLLKMLLLLYKQLKTPCIVCSGLGMFCMFAKSPRQQDSKLLATSRHWHNVDV